MFLKVKNILTSLLSNFVIYYLIPLKKSCYITCAGKSDGLGAQAQAIYSAMLYCSENNIPYCHTPLQEIAHNYENVPSFNKDTEYFFSFSNGEKTVSELKDGYTIINLDIINTVTLFQILRYLFSSNYKVIFKKSHYHNYVNKISPKYITIKKRLQDKFYAHPKSYPANFSDKHLNIAYHIRRGDVDSTDTTRYTDNERIFTTLNTLIYNLNQLGIPLKINIYSQGTQEDFGNLPQIACLHLNGNVFDDFYSLVKADILFMAKSSFSYSAALLSDGIIFYESFWHPPLKDWLVFEKDGRFTNRLQDLIKSVYLKKIPE